jgi:Asp-tRNA(Asn)/Glu-tRNA(Gln) amidotransferase A subunit family amidase
MSVNPLTKRNRLRRREAFPLIGALFTANRGEGKAAAPQLLEEWLHATPAERKQGLQASLERIRQLDGSIHAWVQVMPQPQIADGPLAGIPFAAKDIMETRALVTEYGSPIYKGRHGTEDAAIIRRLESLGAILMGKTHTTQFAYRTPGPTHNPRNLEHTPGGSSSGSAAAVAAGMVPFALGTQTAGSILRPASYCGITGFKPTFGTLPLVGVLPFAHSLDTLGLFTNTPAGMLNLWEALGQSTGRDEELTLGIPEGFPERWPEVEPAMAKAFGDATARLRKRGWKLQPAALKPLLDRLVDESHLVMFYEGARFHADRYKQYGDRLEDMAQLVRDGSKISDQRYRDALSFIAKSKEEVAAQHRKTPIILVPAATGPAPQGLKSTGNPAMNAPWTALGTPAITIPMPVGNALPLGLQLTGAPGQDARVVRAAVRIAASLADV